MPTEIIGEHEIEYSGVQLPGTEEWAANLAIFGPSSNPMHRNIIFPSQRVSLNAVFPTEDAAQKEARKQAMSMIK